MWFRMGTPYEVLGCLYLRFNTPVPNRLKTPYRRPISTLTDCGMLISLLPSAVCFEIPSGYMSLV